MDSKKRNKEEPDILDKYITKIKSLRWQDWILIVAILITFILFLNYINSYQQVPSPVFGGDYYRDRGFVKNIVEGNPIWSDGFYVNEFQYYPYFMVALEAGFVKLTGANLDKTFLLFPLITLILSSITWYLLGSLLFKNKTAGLITSLAFISLIYGISPKSSSFAAFFLIPLFLYLWLKYELSNKTKYAIWTGVILGILALTQGSRFLTALFLIGIYIVITFLIEFIKSKEKLKVIQDYLKKYYLIFLIASLISLIFFLPLIFKYQMHQINHVTEWGDAKLEDLNIFWALKNLGKVFFNTQNVLFFMISMISLLGLTILSFSKKNKRFKWLIIISISNLIAMQHHLITKPLFNLSFLPQKLVYITYLAPLFFAMGVLFIQKKVQKFTPKKIFILIVIVLLLTPTFMIRFNDKRGGKWDSYGMQKNSYTEALYDLADWITLNVKKDEATLSNDESGFMLAVLSGRKVMLTRRTHASYYIDIDKRIAEASVAMYGKDINESKRILKEYNVQYLYVDEHLMKYPMRVRPDLANYLNKYNISFQEVYDRYDIAVPPEQANMLDLLLIHPQEFNPNFLDLWYPVYQVVVNEQVVGILYKLK